VKKHQIAVAVVACLLVSVFTFDLKAQSSTQPSTQSASPASEPWQFRVVPYLWGTSIDGRVGVRDLTANVDASFGNVLDHLHFALMGFADANWNNKFVVLTDAIYTDLRGQNATPGPLFSSVTPNQKMFLLTPEGGYRVLNRTAGSVDVVGGIRYWHLNSELQFQPGLLAATDVQDSRGWVDGIFGLRGTAYIGKWWITGYGDAGGGGSNFTYQILGLAGMDFHTRYALSFGYRYLNVDYNKDHFLFDTALKGPLVGFTFKF
jgi:hypothetical protein